MKLKHFAIAAAAAVFLTGCFRQAQPADKNAGGSPQNEAPVIIGKYLEVSGPGSPFTLLDNKDVLAADGLYYATWGIGDHVPYVNSDGETVDLYDAQLYLLYNECTSDEEASRKTASWLAAAEENYDISASGPLTCEGRTYTEIVYTCTSETSPYTHGVSLFQADGENALCMELTCCENFKDDPETLMQKFLASCHFSTDSDNH